MYASYVSVIGCFLLVGFALHMLVTNMGNRYLNKLLAFLMLARGSQSLYFVLVGSSQLALLEHLLKLFNFFYFAAPACSYLYFRGFLKEETQLRKWEWLHFLPLLIPMADMVSWYELDDFSRLKALQELQTNPTIFIKSSLGLLSNHWNLLICTTLFLIYLTLGGRLLYKASVWKERRKNLLANNWLLFLYGFLLSVQLVRLMPFVTKYLLRYDHLDTLAYRYYLYASSLILFTAIVFILYNPKILYGYVFLSKDFNRFNPMLALKETEHPDKKNANPPALLHKNEQVYKEKIVAYMEETKPYLNPEFSVSQLSHEMNLPLHHCSYIVNYVIGKNFREWVNGYRIAHFISEYPEQIKTKTIVSLSMECGFKNKNTFYNSFKHEMGVAPSEYFQGN